MAFMDSYEELLLFFFVVVDFFLNNNNLQFLTSKIERVLGEKKQIAPDHFNGLYFLPIA